MKSAQNRSLTSGMASVALLLAMLAAGVASAAEAGRARLLPREEPLAGLSLEDEEFEVRESDEASPGGAPLQMVLEGRFERPEWGLLAKSKAVPLKDGKFRLIVPFAQPERMLVLTFRAVGPYGEVEQERMRFQFVPPLPSNGSISVGVGAASVSYTQTQVAPYSGTFLTARLLGRYRFPFSRWFLQGEAWMTAMRASETPANSGVQWLQGEFLVGRRFGSIDEQDADLSKTRFSLLAGPVGTRMTVATQTFGFDAQFRFALDPQLRLGFANGKSLTLEPRFALVFNGPRPIGFASNELGFSALYRLGPGEESPLKDERGSPWSIGAGWHQVSFSVVAGGTIVDVKTSVLQLFGAFRL